MAVLQQDNSHKSLEGALTSTAAVEAVWDEERLEMAMKTLKEMHIQLRGLRTNIPRLTAPLTIPQPSPEALYREFRKSADTAIQEVKDFRRLMTDEESVDVLDHANKSRTERPTGIKTWRPSQDPNWLTRDI